MTISFQNLCSSILIQDLIQDNSSQNLSFSLNKLRILRYYSSRLGWMLFQFEFEPTTLGSEMSCISCSCKTMGVGHGLRFTRKKSGYFYHTFTIKIPFQICKTIKLIIIRGDHARDHVLKIHPLQSTPAGVVSAYVFSNSPPIIHPCGRR